MKILKSGRKQLNNFYNEFSNHTRKIWKQKNKNKNIKTFFSKPVISYSILAAKKSKLFKYVIVSTDSPRIAKNFQKDWCISFFLRPKKISRRYFHNSRGN